MTSPNASNSPVPSEVAARCHEIQTGLGLVEVPEFENLRSVGMAVRLALHIQGLPPINYETLRLVCNHFLKIHTVAVKSIVELLADIEFVKLKTEGRTIKTVVPFVPYYETLYAQLGGLATDLGLNEAEELSVDILCRLSKSPEKVDRLRSVTGAEAALLNRTMAIGQEGAYVKVHRSRSRDIALSPTFFSENAEVYADMVSATGSHHVKKVLTAIKQVQGIPLSLIRKRKEVAGVSLTDDEVTLLMRLAQDGAVKPPSITTSYAGESHFLFTPTPGGAALAPTKRDIYEKAMAIVSSVRQGQFLPRRYAIRQPGALLYKLKNNLRLARATTEATQQYRKLVHLRVARLIDVGNGYSELEIIDTQENREALQIAYALVDSGVAAGTEVDESARSALQEEQSYVESLVASGDLQRREPIELTQEQQLEMDKLFLG